MGNETGMTELPKHQGPAPLAKASEERTVPMRFSKLTPPQAKALRQLLAGARTQERMAEQFRRHFGLPGDFEVSPQQLELAASGALPDPKEYDPRKLDPDQRKLEEVAPATPQLEDLASQGDASGKNRKSDAI